MARRRNPTPHLPDPDLGGLTAAGAPPGPGAAYDALDFADLDLSGLDLRGSRFLGCHLHGVVADGADLRRARFVDCRLERWRATELALTEVTLREVEVRELRVGAFAASGAGADRLLVQGARIDFLDLRGSTFSDVTFVGCDVRDLDASDATWSRVRFEDCRLDGLDVTRATLREVDLRGATLGGVAGVAGLRGALIDGLQLAQLAPLLAGELGLLVDQAV